MIPDLVAAANPNYVDRDEQAPHQNLQEKYAVEHAQPERMATLTNLRHNSAAAATAIRAMTDAQLDKAALISLYGDTPLTLQFWLEDHPISHAYKHLAAIKAAIR